MKRFIIGLTAAVLLLLGLLAAPPAQAEEPDPLTPASNALYTCVQTADTLSVLFVMDRSGSLRTSDPQGVRFEGMRAALGSLADITRPDGQPLAVEVAVGAFNHEYASINEVAGWTQVNTPDSGLRIDQVVARVQNRTAPRGGTDFEEALKGGFEDFQSRLTPGTCRVMLWFTDGKFDNARGASVEVNRADAEQRIEAARQDMCSAGGVVARIREAGIVLIGLQLGEASDDLRRMSVGTLGGQACGPHPVPEPHAPGGYLQASDAGDLAWVFTRMGDLVRGCTPTGSLGGTIDPGLHQALVRVQRDRLETRLPDGEQIELGSPDGVLISAVAPGQAEAGGYRMITDRDSSQVGALVTFPKGGGAGTWTARTTFPPKADGVTWCVMSGLSLSRPDDAALPTAGAESVLDAVILGPDGARADLAPYSSVDVTATVTGQGPLPAVVAVDPTGPVRVSVTPAVTDARLEVLMSAAVTTKSGLRLPPLTLQFATGVLSDDFPSVRPSDVLHLGNANRLEPLEAQLTLVGAGNGLSRVCLGAPLQSAQSRADGVLSVPEGCVDLQANERREVTVRLAPQREFVGTGTAVLPITLVSTSDAQVAGEQSLDLPVRWRHDIPVNLVALNSFFIGTLIITLLLIWLALYLAQYSVARYQTRGLQVAKVDVRLTTDGLRRVARSGRESGALVTDGDFETLDRPNPRRIAVGTVTLMVRAPLAFWRGAEFYAEPASGHRIVGLDGRSSPECDWAPTTPALDHLVLLTASDRVIRESGDSPIPATLFVFKTGPFRAVRPNVFVPDMTIKRLKRAVADEGARDQTSPHSRKTRK